MIIEIIQISIFLTFVFFIFFILISSFLNFSSRINLEREKINSLQYFNEIIENSKKIYVKKIIINNDDTLKSDYLINVKVFFDLECKLNISEKNIILLNNTLNEISFSLYNKTYCSDDSLNSSELIFIINLAPYENASFYLLFGEFIFERNYYLPYTNNTIDYKIIDFETSVFNSSYFSYKMNLLNKYVYKFTSFLLNLTVNKVFFEKIFIEIS